MSVKKLSNLIRARFPLIYVTTYEEERISEAIKNVLEKMNAKIQRELYSWTQTTGLINEATGKNIAGTQTPIKALEFIEKHPNNAVFVMYDFHVNFGCKCRQPDYDVVRKLRDLVPVLKTSTSRKNIIFVSPELVIPDTLQKEITIVDFPLPTIDEIKAKLNKMLLQNKNVKSDSLTEEDKDKLCKSALGLTLQEAENAFALAMVNDGRIDVSDIKIILDEKAQIIKKTGILEFVQSDFSIDDVGGLDNLKNWLKKRNNSWLERAKRYCIPAYRSIYNFLFVILQKEK